MQNLKSVILLLLLCLVASCRQIGETPVSLRPCAPCPIALTAATSAVVGSDLYVMTGRTLGDSLSRLVYCYHSSIDTWEVVDTIPFTPRVNATSAVVGDKIYVGMGFHGKIYRTEDRLLRDWWSYDPATRIWTPCSPYPGTSTVGAVSLVDGTDICCLYGFSDGFSDDVFCYHTQTDSWERKTPGTPPGRMAAVGATLDNLHYFGLGQQAHTLGDWYETDFSVWNRLPDIPQARENAVAVAGTKAIYVIGGRFFAGSLTGGKVYNDILCYHPETRQWTLCATLPNEAEGMIAACIGSIVYLGLGEQEDGNLLQTLYRIHE